MMELLLSRIERGLVDLVTRVAPWLAPIPTAYLVYARTVEHLSWPVWLGIVAGIVLELIGLAVTNNALSLFSYNASKRKSDPVAPVGLALVLVGVYFVIAELLTLGLDIAPKLAAGVFVTLADWTPAVFPILSLSAVSVLALQVDQTRRLDAIAEQKASRKRSRKTSTVSRKTSSRTVQEDTSSVQKSVQNGVQEDTNGVQKNVQKSVQHGVLDAVNVSKTERRARLLDTLLDIYRTDPGAGPTQVARQLGIGRSTVYTYLSELEAAGRIRKNGHGVEVLI